MPIIEMNPIPLPNIPLTQTLWMQSQKRFPHQARLRSAKAAVNALHSRRCARLGDARVREASGLRVSSAPLFGLLESLDRLTVKARKNEKSL
jgi:hypothetical protein